MSRVFWERCSPEGGHRSGASARNERHQNPSPEARFGARRIDLLDGWGRVLLLCAFLSRMLILLLGGVG